MTVKKKSAAKLYSEHDWGLLRGGCSWCPHELLGGHAFKQDDQTGVMVRTWHPAAIQVDLLHGGQTLPMKSLAEGGLFGVFLPGVTAPANYRLRFHFPNGASWERDDPYRFLPTVSDLDLYLFNEGNHRRLWECLGAHPRSIDGVRGVSFAVWAPNAAGVSVVGDFCHWDGRLFPMRVLGNSGVWELFVPDIAPGSLYKFEVRGRDGRRRLKADPMSLAMELPPGTGSRIHQSHYTWTDSTWMERRRTRNVLREPLAIYELHLGSWLRGEDGRMLTYRELAPKLVAHVKRFGFNCVQPLPLEEHPFGGSWGYQVSGYYAPTARFGAPDDLKFFVDYCHQHEVAVIMDWVPAHFPKDDFALARFDGTALYEHDDPRRGEHPDWGTLIFNFGRNEVRNFLISNAVYWLKEYHIDGLRVDAVASMLYLDYSRKAGEWLPNKYGGRENLEAIEFIQKLNVIVQEEEPGAIMVAEESTAWGGVTRPVHEGGLGFTFKWNMGWMHDTLTYFSKEPIHRRFHHFELSFAMIYEYTERFIMPISHDEVVHGKGALLAKMPGDPWRQFANLRTLLAYLFTRPGKKLLFMGTELAPWYEWNYEHGLDWSLEKQPERAALQRFMEDLGRLYHEMSCFWRLDHEPGGYGWIDCHDCDNSVFSYFRRDGDQFAAVILNLTPVPRDHYRVGLPLGGQWVERLNSDNLRYGGSDYATRKEFETEPTPWHGQGQSVELNLPPLGALVLVPGPAKA